MLNREQRKMLMYPCKPIVYILEPKEIKIDFYCVGLMIFKEKFSYAISLRESLHSKRINAKVIYKEYKMWVDSINIFELVTLSEQVDLDFEMIFSKSKYDYLVQKYKDIVPEIEVPNLLALNPLVEYHIENYCELQNNYRESVKNYFSPKFLKKL